MPGDFEIRDAASVMPDGLAPLEAEARGVGIRNMTALVERWIDGSERYDQPGEQMLVAIDDLGEVVGVGGVAWCPDVSGALRVRRFYVAERWRRRGVAGALARRLVADAFEHTDVITCNARASDAAPPFWESMGFLPTDTPGITHVLRKSTDA